MGKGKKEEKMLLGCSGIIVAILITLLLVYGTWYMTQ